MDLVDLIQGSRFLGHEFLMWLWYKSEVFEGHFNIGKRSGCEVWFDDQITLEALVVETEQTKLKGASPSVTPEAREALRQGKLPTQGKLRIGHEEQEWLFLFKGAEFALSGIKIPAVLSKQTDEKFYERMYLVEELESLIDDLYGEFLSLRLSPAWSAVFAPAVRDWIATGGLMDAPTFREMREQGRALTVSKRVVAVAAEGTTAEEPGEEAQAPA